MKLSECVCDRCEFAVPLNWYQVWLAINYPKDFTKHRHEASLHVMVSKFSKDDPSGNYICRKEYEPYLHIWTNITLYLKKREDFCSLFSPGEAV